MVNITKLYCGAGQPADHLRYGHGQGAPKSAAERKRCSPPRLNRVEALTQAALQQKARLLAGSMRLGKAGLVFVERWGHRAWQAAEGLLPHSAPPRGHQPSPPAAPSSARPTK